MSRSDRTCVCCGVQAPRSRLQLEIGREPLMSLSVIIFRRVSRRKQLKSTAATNICESCLQQAIETRGDSEPGRILAEALYRRVAERYNAMKGSD